MTRNPTLIVGQGIAGTLAAFMLHRYDMPFMMIDPGNTLSSSQVAAGMFTPISGKRKTIPPLAGEQISLAITVYRQLEQLLETPLLHLQNVYQVYHDAAECDNLVAKGRLPLFDSYLHLNPVAIPQLHQPLGACTIGASGWVDCAALIQHFSQWLKDRSLLLEDVFDYTQLKVAKQGIMYEGNTFCNIIFCEGYQAINNPFFSQEKIIPCKGNVLTIHSASLPANYIIKKNGIYLVPLGDGLFKVGATYQWNNASTIPDNEGRLQLEQQLHQLLNCDYTVVDHQAGVRPTTLNREVTCCQHPKLTGMYMFNGLGTKGVTQAPWYARQLVKGMVASAMQ